MLGGKKRSGGRRDPLTNKLLELLYEARKRKGWTVRDLAAAADISPSYVSLIENGHKSPDPATLERIGRALDVEPRLLRALVTLQGHPRDPQEAWNAAEVLMGNLGDLEATASPPRRLASPAMLRGAAPMESVDMLRSPAPPALISYAAALRTELPDADRFVVAIPMVEEGQEP